MGFGHEKLDVQQGSIPIPIPTTTPMENMNRRIANHFRRRRLKARLRHTYNSCQTRHCPTCQAAAQEKWLDARLAEVLPVQYFHVVFTLPHGLSALIEVLAERASSIATSIATSIVTIIAPAGCVSSFFEKS